MIFNIFKKKPIPLKELTNEEFNEAKFKARVVFIDDEEVVHIERLRNDGYNITHFSDIDNIDDFIRKKYHVIILDIQGVGKKLTPETEGWGLLKYLKEECPHFVVIMFTGADWSITKYKNTADVADDFIGKDLEFLDFKLKLDNGIRKAFSPNFHLEITEKKLLKQISNADTIKQIKDIISSHGGDQNATISLVKKVTNNKPVLDAVSSLLSVTNGVTKLFD
ncbi:MAG: hypothetical protein C0448_10970 [Sphingobacteriaceae bacterium]|nr:hypothetical protein [Sphingobacteriaceae bacterium]